MFESQSPTKRRIIEKFNIEDKPNNSSREKISKLLMSRYMKTHQINKPDLRIAEEIQKFVNETRNTEKELKEFDKKIEKIVRDIKSNSPRNYTKDINVKNSIINQSVRENDDVMKGKSINELNSPVVNIKLPLVQTKSETTTGSSVKPDSRSSKRSKMSGASKLSNFNEEEQINYKLKSMLRNMSIGNDNFKNKNQNLPYDINDYDSIIKYDTMLFNEELKKKKENKLNFQRLMRKTLDEQIEEKEAKMIEEKRWNYEFDEYINKHNKELEKEENEKKLNTKNRYKEDLDSILRIETLKKIDSLKQDFKIEREYVKSYVDQVNKEKQIKLNKKKMNRQFFEELKKLEEIKKDNDMRKTLQDKENDIKLNEDTNFLLDKQEKMRLHKYHSQNTDNNVKAFSQVPIVIDTDEPPKNNCNNSTNNVQVHSPSVKHEETFLKQMLFENMKKYNLLEEKIKDIEEKIGNTRLNTRSINLVPTLIEKPNNSLTKADVDSKHNSKVDIKIIRPSNSFIGKKIPDESTRYSRSINQSNNRLKPLSKKRENDKSMFNLKKNIKNNQKNTKNSLLFTTQLS